MKLASRWDSGLLGMAAVAIATAAIFMVLGYQGASNREVLEMVTRLGANLVYVVLPDPVSLEKLKDLERLPEIEAVTGQGSCSYFYSPATQYTMGWQLVTPNFPDVLGMKLAFGTGFSPDVPDGVILGWEVKEVLFGEEDPVGQKLDGRPIIGVLALIHSDDSLRERWNRRVLHTRSRQGRGPSEIPSNAEGFQFIYVRAAASPILAEELLAERFPGAKLFRIGELYAFWLLPARILNRVLVISALGLLGLATLLLAITSLVSTYKRTRELGIRRAAGAAPRDILSRLVWEGGRRVGVSGGVGLIAGVVAVFLSRPAAAFWWPQALVLPGVFLVVLPGIVFPAWWAARITPVEALRRRTVFGRHRTWSGVHLLIVFSLAVGLLYSFLLNQLTLGVNSYLRLSWGKLDERVLLVRSPKESILTPPMLAPEDGELIRDVKGVELAVPIVSQALQGGIVAAAVGGGIVDLGFLPVIAGRLLQGDDFTDGRPVCLVSGGFAQRRGILLEEAPMVVVRGTPFQVVGVFEDAYIRAEFPVDILFTDRFVDLLPVGHTKFFVRLDGGTSLDVPREEIVRRFSERYPQQAKVEVTWAMGRQADIVGFFRAGARRIGLTAAAALLLVTGQAVGLVRFLLARRRMEYGIRRAVGASPHRILATVVMEVAGIAGSAFLLATVGGVLLSPQFLSCFFILPQPPWWGSLPLLAAIGGIIIVIASLPARTVCSIPPAGLVEGSRE